MAVSGVRAILGPDGSIARRLPGYESRPQQLRMAEAVADAIAGQRHLMVEAGTGVGKSFAYLVPAILAATESGKKVVVSTHTISLQEQLLHKDIPFLRAVLPCEFSAVLVKGRANYLSRRRLRRAYERSGSLMQDEDELDQLAKLRDWAGATTDGSLSDLAFKPRPAVWDSVASDHGDCLGRKCPTYKDCFYFQARRRIGSANLLIVNHAFYMTDLALRDAGAGVLPEHHLAIFDEAHTLEEVAASHLGLRMGNLGVEQSLGRLYSERTGKGLLVYQRLLESIAQVKRTREASRRFFDALIDWQSRHGATNGRLRQPPPVPDVLSEELLKLATQIRNDSLDVDTEDEQVELAAAAERVDSAGRALRAWMAQDVGEPSVFWVESDPARKRIQLACAPIDVGPVLRRSLFSEVPSCILTSATLCAGTAGSFSFAKSRIGLTRCETLAVGSSFDFERQVRLHIAVDLPDPSTEPEIFEAKALSAIRHYLELTHGKAFVLFTSYRFLKAAEVALAPWLAERNLALHSQASGVPRSKLIEAFRADVDSVLFGVDSFWQGVDVPGATLSNVIITRLPFAVPDEPVTQARLEAIQNRGGNSFVEYTVPEAILKLKQGFGRLIRSRSDRGIVAILDPRVLTKRYGRLFLDALPSCPRQLDRIEDLIANAPPPARRPEAR
jgi:ATP-dependent DNA helicase DinG